MRKLTCPNCGNRVYFENQTCDRCGQGLGFDAVSLKMCLVEAVPPLAAAPGVDSKAGVATGEMAHRQLCANSVHGACNWLVEPDTDNALCLACDLNRTIPNLSEPGNLAAWQDVERAKKWLIYSLLRLGLALDVDATGALGEAEEAGADAGSPNCAGNNRLAFDFVHDSPTSHHEGLITVNLLEADAVERERQRQRFNEPYRTLLGHLRHEIGHFYWMVLIDRQQRLDQFRAIFGDERQDYAAALASHHANGPAADWQQRHLSSYASAHPWEDWAETWAHYLHILSALDTAEAEGIEPRAAGMAFGSLWPFKSGDVYREESFAAIIERWIPLSLALNSLSRSMGHPDFYPFVISATARDKLAFVHDVASEASRPAGG